MKTLPLNRGLKSWIMLLFLTCLLACSCEQSTSPGENGRISAFSADPASVDVWLSIKTEGSVGGQQLTVRRGDSTIHRFAAVVDTTVIDEGLQPASSYAYSVRLESSGDVISSQSLTVTTLDTTSHVYNREINLIGTFGSSLRDVYSENNNTLWAVGEIRTDTTDEFGAAKWVNGVWEYKRLKGPGIAGQTVRPRSIWYFADNDIWFGSGSILHFDGDSTSLVWQRDINTDEYVERLWGFSPNSLFAVGDEGLVVYYDGNNWRKLPTTRDIELTDIWGTGPDNVWICGFEAPVGTVIYHYDGRSLNEWFYAPYAQYIHLDPNRVSGPIISLWTDSPNYLWVITYWGLYKLATDNPGTFIRYPDVNAWNGFPRRLRGTSSNNLYFVGDFGIIWHFNGVSLNEYSVTTQSFGFKALWLEEDQLTIVGRIAGGEAVVLRGQKP